MFSLFLSICLASFLQQASATQPGATTGWVTQYVYQANDLKCSGQPSQFIAYALGLCYFYNGNYTFNSGNVTRNPKTYEMTGNLITKTYGHNDSTCNGA